MNPLYPKAVWGFNGTERPGAVYLAAVLAAHNQKGLPAFGIYGRDVQDRGDGESRRRRGEAAALRPRRPRRRHDARQVVPVARRHLDGHRRLDRRRRLLRGLPRHARRAGRHDRVRPPHRGEDLRRGGVRAGPGLGEGPLPGGPRLQRPGLAAHARAEGRRLGDVGQDGDDRARPDGRQPAAGRAGFGEEALGHNAILGGFQGQRHWTDHFPNGDFMEAILNSSFDWNGIREPFVFATENDSLNGVSHAVRPPAHEHGADLRRRAHLLEPGGGQARHRPRRWPAPPPAASST